MVMTAPSPQRLWRTLKVGVAAAWMGLASPSAAHAESEAPNEPPEVRYAVIAHPAVERTRVSRAELQSIALGRLRYWSTSRPIQVVLGAEGSTSRELWVEDIADMSAPQFTQFWIGATFRGRAVIAPRGVPSDEVAVRLVAALPGAIAIVPASLVSDAVRVLQLNEKGTATTLSGPIH
jgi:ABC-type phosphate transport system substrate-binding protein